MQAKTLIDVLRYRSVLTEKGITLIEGSEQETFVSYRQLYEDALRGLSFLQAAGLQPGDELILQVDHYRTFLIGFWACVLGGIIPVPLTVGQQDEHRQKMFNVWSVLNKPWLLTTGGNLEKLEVHATANGIEAVMQTIKSRTLLVEGLHESKEAGRVVDSVEEDIAFIQFSSGSTGSPKGVVLTHKNLLVNIASISLAAGYQPADSLMSWMPLTHDMGLIGFHLNPLCAGIQQYLIPTAVFIRRPALWFDKASEHRVTILCSPNFGYRYILKNTTPQQRQAWDLSAVRILYNGAEPISLSLCNEFLEGFAASCIKPGVLRPVYGLAEASLAVSFSPVGKNVDCLYLDRNLLREGDRIKPVEPGEQAIPVVNVGSAVAQCSLRITGPANRPLADGVVGHIQIKGPNVTAGYYNNPGETEKIRTADGWLDTGDLGFLLDGALYITGRAKDIIFMNGRNYYPHDLERIAEEVPGIELNKIVIAGRFNETVGRDEAFAFVFHRGDQPFAPVAQALVEHISLKTGLQINTVIPVKDIPRTTSGKLQRFRLLEQYMAGRFAGAALFSSSPVEQQDLLVLPETDTEAALCRIWEKVLKRRGVSTTASFFAMGGDSLKAAALMMLVLQEWEVELSPDILFEAPTVRMLAQMIDHAPRMPYTAIPVAAERAFYPLTAAQKIMYYAWEADKDSLAYNIPLAFRFNRSIDAEKLETAIRKLAVRHEALRMTFHWQGEPVCRIDPTPEVVLHKKDYPAGNTEEALKLLVQPFDLRQGPLLRTTLFTSPEQAPLLFLDFHHIIADGLSVHHFLEELVQLYEGFDLAPTALQYKDYACHEKSLLDEAKVRQQGDWWAMHLQGGLPVLEMPLDFPRPALFDTRGEKKVFSLDASLSRQLKALADAQQCTLHVLLFTLYNLLLSKYTGQDDLVVGIPVAGRRHPGLERLQGMFVNNLPVRTTVKGDELFTALLARVNAKVKDALRYQDYPFSALVQRMDVERNMSRNPVFDTMFIYQNMGLPQAGVSGLELSRYFFDAGIAKYDLSMEVFEGAEGIRIYIEYATQLFRRSTIDLLAAHFIRLAEGVVADPVRQVMDMSLVRGSEYAHLINTTANHTDEYQYSKTIHQLFKEQVERTPAGIALLFGEQKITYRALNEQADALAVLLRQKGIAPNVIAGLFMRRTPELIISILAVLKAGGCYLPIDTDLPAARVEYLVADSRCKVLITSDPCAALLPPVATHVINIDHLETKSGTGQHPAYVGSVNDLAYVIYTSGTTGAPKGVMIEHRSLVNYITWAAAEYIHESQAAFPLFTSIAFDLTVTSLFTPLITGNTVVIYEESDTVLPLETVVADNKVQVIKLTPSHLKVLAAADFPIDPVGNTIRRFIVGGEQLDSRLARSVYEKFGSQVEIYNEYGPTEATVGCMIYRFNPKDEWTHVPIGLPAANTNIYILDKYQRPLPAGIDGELYIGGLGVARGYLFNEALTRQKFLSDPFVPGQLMYHSGDIARILPDGNITYIGRYDQQVKINGHRIELAEIENVLMEQEGIEQALVVVQTHPQGYPYLHVCFTARAGFQESLLPGRLANRLPHYMVPAAFSRLEAIPLTRNGKIDYAALPAPGAGTERDNDLPGNDLEQLMVKTWQTVLGEHDISVTDNFFALGGDSIKAVQIVARLAASGVTVTVKDILTYNTIRRVAAGIPIAATSPAYEQGTVAGSRKATPIEAWFLAQDFEEPGHYNQTIVLDCKRKPAVHLLEASLEALVMHHDGLRINYDTEEKRFYYNESFAGRKFAIELLKEMPAATGFDITHELLLRASLISGSDGTTKLLLTAHHLLVDGVSWRILLEDLYAVYTALEKGVKPHLALKTASGIEWEKQVSAYAANVVMQSQASDAHGTTHFIPLDFETACWKVKYVRTCTATLSKEKTGFLMKEAYKVYQTDIQVLLNAALVLTLNEWTGLDQFTIEQENHGRHLEGIDVGRTTGWFTAMYPVTLRLVGDTLASRLQTIKEQLEQLPGKGLDYGIRQYYHSAANRPGRQLSEIRFNYLGRFDQELNNDLFTFCGFAAVSDIGKENEMTSKLELNVMVLEGELQLAIQYNENAHRQTTIQWLADTMLQCLTVMASDLQRSLEQTVAPARFSVSLDQEELDALFFESGN